MPSSDPPPLFKEMRKLCHLGINLLLGELLARAERSLRGVSEKTLIQCCQEGAQQKIANLTVTIISS